MKNKNKTSMPLQIDEDGVVYCMNNEFKGDLVNP